MRSDRRGSLLALLRFVKVALFFGFVTCSCRPEPRKQSSSEALPTLDYSFAGVDGEVIDRARHSGRVTVLLFVTTFDLASQVQARRLQDLFRTHVPRTNAAAIVLEAPKYVDLAREFREQLALSYDVAITDKKALETHPILSRVQTVPTWIVLNRASAIIFVGTGALTPARLEEVVRAAE